MILKKLIMSFQQHLMRRTWAPKRQEKEIYMIIKGKILNTVRLNDIGRTVECGKEISLNEYEVNRSKDLQNAIKREWVEIVYDRGMMKRAVVVQGSSLQEKQAIEADVLDLAKKLAMSMAEEMVKNSSLVKDIAKEVAKEMVTELKDNLRVEQVVVNNSTSQNKKIELDSPDNVFVDFKDEEVGIKASLNKSSQIEMQKDDLTSSLEKMKKFKQNKKD
jgi:hypothetical protein